MYLIFCGNPVSAAVLSYLACWQDVIYFTCGKFGVGVKVFSLSHYFLSPSLASPDMNEILLTGTFSLNSIKISLISSNIIRWRNINNLMNLMNRNLDLFSFQCIF